ncbi:hypothetical protein [Dactylosporangium cerinum]
MPRPYFSLEAPDAGSIAADGSVDQRARLAARAAEWQRRREEKLRVRAEFAEARAHGLAARHAVKLARIHASRAGAPVGVVVEGQRRAGQR